MLSLLKRILRTKQVPSGATSRALGRVEIQDATGGSSTPLSAAAPGDTRVDLLKTCAREAIATSIAAPLNAPASTDHPLVALGDILKTIEVPEAESYIGELFRRKFGDPAPDFPRHFVCIYKTATAEFWPVGYVHFSRFDDSFLAGGLVIDDRAYRRMPDVHRKSIRGAGGIAEKMLRDTLAVLSEAPAVWVYVGDAKSEKVSLRVGFRHTDHPYIMVVWNKDLSDAEKCRRLAVVTALGPF